jgi:diaminopimelate epimerase
MPIEFSKYEGLGNDFLVVDADSESAISPEQAVRLCDRRFGVGADGVLLVLPPRTEGAGARMRVLNADGSVPEMCGNGLRCAALHVARRRDARDLELLFDTDAGPRACSVRRHDGGDGADVTVDMGDVRALGRRTLEAGGEVLDVALADAGNPHAILFEEPTAARLAAVGPAVEKHAAFPRGTNVELARVEGSRIDVAVWERGVGPTLACGTGACAVAVVARAEGRVPDGPVTVRLPGGELQIELDPSGRTRMRGPARLVFTGRLP